MAWALEDAPGVPAPLVSVLVGLANHADRDGRGAHPHIDTLAKYTRKSHRQVQRDLEKLAALGLIRLGDQRLVAHIRQDRRPVVWDLAMAAERDSGGEGDTPERGDTHDTPSPESGMSPMSPRGASRGDTHVTPRKPRGDIHDAHGVTPMTPPIYEPSIEPSTKPPAHAATDVTPVRARAREERQPPAIPDAPPGPGVSGPSAADAYRLVNSAIGKEFPSAVRTALAIEAGRLLLDGHPPALISQALHLWLEKPSLGPKTLPLLVADVLRAARAPASGQGLSTADRRVLELELLKDNPDPRAVAALAAAGVPIPTHLRALPGGAA